MDTITDETTARDHKQAKEATTTKLWGLGPEKQPDPWGEDYGWGV